MKYDTLREKALANIILLFDYWKLDYTRVNEDEFDFINPTREDNRFGACRFNIKKGLGADFTGSNFSEYDPKEIGLGGFDKSDFASYNSGQQTNFGFDIIGLCQRLFNCNDYGAASKLLATHLEEISKNNTLQKVDLASAIKRQHEADEQKIKKLQMARKIWNICIPVDGTLGEKYLKSRSIHLSKIPQTIRFHSKIMNTETKCTLPALLFKVSTTPGVTAPLEAIHRIYLKADGSGKAQLNSPKMALGDIKGKAIWFGENDDTLCICEGPENALSIVSLGYKLVAASISGANFNSIIIPSFVKQIILMPDGDIAGVNSVRKAIESYTGNYELKLVYPPKKDNNPKWDWNDELMSRGNGNREQ